MPVPDQIVDLDSPSNNPYSLFVFPSPWYLASPRLPLIFDVTHHPHSESQTPSRQATRFRLDLLRPALRPCASESTQDGSMGGAAVSLRVERISRFRFPRCNLSFMEGAQIPGWFSVGLHRLSSFEPPGVVKEYMTCIYEPGLGMESGSVAGSLSIDPEVAKDDLAEGGQSPSQETGDVDQLRDVRLSMILYGSLRGEEIRVWGRVPQAFHAQGRPLGPTLCIFDQEPSSPLQ